ncbi:hypothetical protein [Planotetraspora mira]|uniref:hypothetical protein n=1 Tax=Planotetraspora mira TaxID=58121 RepID=UPI00367125EC
MHRRARPGTPEVTQFDTHSAARTVGGFSAVGTLPATLGGPAVGYYSEYSPSGNDHQDGFVNRLTVQSGSEDLVCLFIEPYGENFWLKPGDKFTVVPAEDTSDPQFTVVAATDHMVVWIYESGDPEKVIVDYAIIDNNGTALECGHQQPVD